jgi:hypothetical protein
VTKVRLNAKPTSTLDSDAIAAGPFSNPLAALAVIAQNAAVYVSASGVIANANASAVETADVVGFSESLVALGEVGRVFTLGEVSVIADPASPAFVAGDILYLSPLTAGTVTSTPPSVSGHVIQKVGVWTGSKMLVSYGEAVTIG